MKIGGDPFRLPGAIIALSVRRGLVAAASEGSYHSKSVTVFELATGAVRIRETKSIRRAGSARHFASMISPLSI